LLRFPFSFSISLSFSGVSFSFSFSFAFSGVSFAPIPFSIGPITRRTHAVIGAMLAARARALFIGIARDLPLAPRGQGNEATDDDG
jgi:hypothetical protein